MLNVKGAAAQNISDMLLTPLTGKIKNVLLNEIQFVPFIT